MPVCKRRHGERICRPWRPTPQVEARQRLPGCGEGRVCTYTEIGRDLLDGIRMGSIPTAFLPPATALAQRYGVSSTLRRRWDAAPVGTGGGVTTGAQVTLGRMQLSEESICQAGNRRGCLST
ncbi:MAG: hypothetical protein ACLSB9_33855 [Hydrogeniiclostridium mannosilyticum]